jgi:hypothetical protein
MKLGAEDGSLHFFCDTVQRHADLALFLTSSMSIRMSQVTPADHTVMWHVIRWSSNLFFMHKFSVIAQVLHPTKLRRAKGARLYIVNRKCRAFPDFFVQTFKISPII